MRVLFPIVVVMLLCFGVLGCSPGTPPSVTALHLEMDRAIKAQADADRERCALLLSMYEEAVNQQVELVLDYEIRLFGDVMEAGKLKELVTAYRAKYAEINANIAALKAELSRSDLVYDQLREISSKLGQWLSAQRDETAELREALLALHKEGR